jgi:hypothetical protein
MDIKYWKAFAALGVPGLALGIFYKLYQKFDWPLKNIPTDRMFILVLVFMGIIAAVVLFALFLWRPRSPEPLKPPDSIAVSVPKGWTFKHAAQSIASRHIVTFVGFSAAELAVTMQSRDFVASSAVEALRQIRTLANGKLPAYEVELASSGQVTLRVV